MKKILLSALTLIAAFSVSTLSYALKTDQSQPATLDADEFDLDFQTGVRTYRGNVVFQQGSIRLFADEIVAYFKKNELERVIARGNPARFSQRPDDKDTDVVGTALRIEMDDKSQLVILQERAKVTQEDNTITGKKITYNMTTDKVNVRSGKRKTPIIPKPAEAVVDNKTLENADEALTAAKQKLKDELEQAGSGRARLVIKPRKK